LRLRKENETDCKRFFLGIKLSDFSQIGNRKSMKKYYDIYMERNYIY